MCGEEQKTSEREEKRNKFIDELHEFVCDRVLDIHAEDMAEALLYEAKNVSSLWFGCYLHMLGFLTKNLHEGIEKQFNDVRNLIKEAKEEDDAANTM